MDSVKEMWLLNERAYVKMLEAKASHKSAVAAMQKVKAALKSADELYGYPVNANNGQVFFPDLVTDSLDHGKCSENKEHIEFETDPESLSIDSHGPLQIAPEKYDNPNMDSVTKSPNNRELTATPDTNRKHSPLSHLIDTMIPKRHRSMRPRRISFAGVGSLQTSESKSSMLPHHTTNILKKRRSARKKICSRWKWV